ncbi:MAG: hypothetical protein MR423_03045 [Firmicutes bacterium]|nr:hypothetical protein [Bacillota bacterium]MDY3658795.1 hypothetical protein [Eubacteriales bacterium]
MKNVKKIALTALTLGVMTSALSGCNMISFVQTDCFIEHNGVLHFGVVELPMPFSGGNYKILTKCGITEEAKVVNYSRSKNTSMVKNNNHRCEECFGK